MALNVSVFPRMQLRHGQFPVVLPLAGPIASFAVEAGGAASPAIAAGSVIRLIADEDQRLAWSTDAELAPPPADGMKLVADVEYRFELPEGANPYYLRVIAG